ncbi:MAG: hypothetical protein BMS9Abin10_0457 [Gammaproteobacteria bacterium]|nr:MAG: hypothetical protein BMS9Abin10_0457 [Gammaproteobacteria bacterium]
MSTDIPAEALPVSQRSRKRFWASDLRTARIVRFSVGVTTATAIAFGFNWPLFFLTPLFTAVFLALPLPAPTLKQGLHYIIDVFAAFALGLVFTLFLLPYPLVYVPALGLVLFQIYYLANRGGPVFLVLMSLVAVLILPMLGMAYEALAIVFVLYFAWSAVLAIVFVILAHGLFPDPPSQHPALRRGSFQPGYSREAALTALKSTVAILPIAILFIASNWTGQILIMVFAAIFSLSPELSKGKGAALKSLTSTLIGGFAAVVFFYLIVAVPEFHFFIALMLLTTLLFGSGIFSDKPLAKYLSSAVTALIVLIGGSMGENVSITDKFAIRVVLTGAAVLYVVGVLTVLDHVWPRRNQGG